MVYSDIFLTLLVISCLAALATTSVVSIIRGDRDAILCGSIAILGCASIFVRIPESQIPLAVIIIGSSIFVTALARFR